MIGSVYGCSENDDNNIFFCLLFGYGILLHVKIMCVIVRLSDIISFPVVNLWSSSHFLKKAISSLAISTCNLPWHRLVGLLQITINSVMRFHCNMVKRRVAQNPQCTSFISHNAPFCNRNVHVCTFLIQNDALRAGLGRVLKTRVRVLENQ